MRKSNLKKSNEVFETFRKLKSLVSVQFGIDWEKAKLLSFLKRENNFRIITGDRTSTWRAFLADPEIKAVVPSVYTADRIVRLYRVFIEELGFTPKKLENADTYCLGLLVWKNRKLAELENWIEKAKHLSRSDFIRELKFGEVDVMKCPHKEYRFIHSIKECVKCGLRLKEKKHDE